MLPGGGLDDPLRNILEKLPQHIVPQHIDIMP